MRPSVLALLAVSLVTLGGVSDASAQTVTDRYDDAFRMYSKRFFGPGHDWRLFKAQAMAESGLDPNARSWVGARGLMQLMPATFKEVQSTNDWMAAIDDPVWNIAAGVYYDRQLWRQWGGQADDAHRQQFMLGSYNAGRATLLRAQRVAADRALDPVVWPSIQTVAADVPRWRSEETLGYVTKIERNIERMDSRGRVARK